MPSPKYTKDLVTADYKPDLSVVVSDPLLANLADGDPLKQSKKIDLADILATTKQWDVTPTVDTAIGDPIVTDSINMIVDQQSGLLTFDTTNAPPFDGQAAAFHIAVAKTSTNISSMGAGEATFVAYNTNTLNASNSVGLCGVLVCGNSAATVDDVQAFMTELLINNNRTIDGVGDTVLLVSGDYGGPKVAGGFITVRDSVNPLTPAARTLASVNTNTTLVGSGKRTTLLLSKEATTLSLAYALSDSAETTVDVISTTTLADSPTLPDDAVVFYIMIGLNLGFGMPSLAITPSTETGKSTYAITGNSVNTVDGVSQNDWDVAYPHPFTPLISNVYTHATFPAYATNGSMLQIYVDPNYVGNTPMPYGIPVANGELCVVDEVAIGDEAFTLFPKKAAVDVLKAILDVNSGRINTLTTQVSAAAKVTNLSEVIVYAGHPDITATDLPGPSVYASFDEAYEYLLTLPGFIKKRIVLDDREPVYYEGTTNYDLFTTRKYLLMSNNIALSTYRAFIDDKLVGSNINLSLNADGLKLLDFEGVLQPVGLGNGFYKEVVDLAETIAPSYGARFNEDNFVIGVNSNVISYSAAVKDTNGGSIVLLDNAIYTANYIVQNGEVRTNSIVITKSAESTLVLDGNMPEFEQYGNKSIKVYTSTNEFPTVVGFGMASSVLFIYLDPLQDSRFYYPGFITLDSTASVVANTTYTSGTYNLNPGQYVVVGTIDISNITLYVSDSTTIVGVAEAEFISNTAILNTTYADYEQSSGPDIRIRNVDFTVYANGGVYAIRLGGDVKIYNCTVNALDPFSIHGVSLLLENVKTPGLGSTPSRGSFITTLNTIIDGIHAKLDTVSPFISSRLAPMQHLVIVNALIDYPYGVNSTVGLIHVGPTALNVSSVVSLNKITFANAVPRLFMDDLAVLQDPTIYPTLRSDTFKRFARFSTSSLKYGVNSTVEPITVPISPDPEIYGFQGGNYGSFIYLGEAPTRFVVEATISYQQPSDVLGQKLLILWEIRKNGGTVKSQWSSNQTVAGSVETVRISTVVWLSKNDYISVLGATPSFTSGSPYVLDRAFAAISITEL